MKSKLLPGRALMVLVAATVLAVLAACVASPTSSPVKPLAAYELSGDASELRFVTTKNTNVAEVQQFKRLSGSLGTDGTARLVIDLASVETQIPIRNERMRDMLFEVTRFPMARFDGVIDPKVVKQLAAGESADIDVTGKLSLHGQTEEVAAQLRVVKLAGEKLLVSTRSPILVSAGKFALSAGIEKLREIMGLPNIIGTVPVSLTLVFAQRPVVSASVSTPAAGTGSSSGSLGY